MPNEIVLKGITDSDGRILAYLDVTFNDVKYDWATYIPQGVGLDWIYIQEIQDKIYSEIADKLLMWDNLDPKTRVIEDPFGGENTIVDIDISEIVKPEIPDYWILRSKNYPKIGDQLDAIWKGSENKSYWDILDQITNVKETYNTNPWQTKTPEESFIDKKQKAKKKLALTRWLKEIGGVSYLDKTFDTDNNSQSKVLAAYIISSQEPNFTCNWKTKDGTFVSLNNQDIITLLGIIRSHVQTVFDWEASIKTQLDNVTNDDELNLIIDNINNEFDNLS